MKRLIIVISILTLILALAMVGASLMSREKELKDSQITISNLEFDLNSCKIIYNDLLNNKQTINKQLEEKTKLAEELSLQIESLQNELLQAEENNTLQQEEILNLQTQIESLQEQLKTANAEIEDLKNQSNVIDDRILSYMAIITGSDYEGDFVIPEGVTTIRDNAFKNMTNIKGRLILPSSLTYMGDFAFSHTGITSVENINVLNTNCFEFCENLKNVYFSSKFTNMHLGAFVGCPNIENIIVDEANTKFTSKNINGLLLKTNGCLVLGGTKTVFTEEIKKISNCAFSGRSLQVIEIPSSVKIIDSNAFLNSSLETIILNSGLEQLGAYCFSGCKNLSSIYIYSSVTSIPTNVFKNCSSSLVIYCETNVQPSGWVSNWNYYDTSHALTTYYGYTYEQYLEAIATE